MTWAANHKTIRIEDIAYCLLGIFNVNMPMMYGKGTKAFEKVQEAIIKGTIYMSIFAWKAKDTSQDYSGILVQSPAEFAHYCRLCRAPTMRYGYETSMTNKGLRLETFLGKGNILNLSFLLPNDVNIPQAAQCLRFNPLLPNPQISGTSMVNHLSQVIVNISPDFWTSRSPVLEEVLRV
jgi:hypothetical protein